MQNKQNSYLTQTEGLTCNVFANGFFRHETTINAECICKIEKQK